MKNFYTNIIQVIIFLMLLNSCSGFKDTQRYGDRQFNLGRYYTAVKAYEQSFEVKPSYDKAKKIAKTYTKLKDYDNSKLWWGKTVNYSTANFEDYKKYINSIYQSGSSEFYNIDSILISSNIDPEQYENFKIDISNIPNNEKLKLVQEQRFNQFNSAEAGIFVDKNDQFFISTNGSNKSKPVKVKNVRIDKGVKYSKDYLDFNNNPYFKIMIPNSENIWSELKLNLKNIQQYGSIGINEKDQTAFVTVFRNLDNFEKRNISLNSEIFYGKIDQNFQISIPKPFPLNQPFEYSVLTPYVDSDKKLIYFSSDMPGGFGGLDLYVVSYTDDYVFSSPVNLGSSINTINNESFPFIKRDILYFSSDGHYGLGGLDVFSSQIENQNYLKPLNLGSPINSKVDDFSYIIDSKDDQFLISNRGEKYGVDQVYKVIHSDFKVILEFKNVSNLEQPKIKVFNDKGEEIKVDLSKNELSFKADEPINFIVVKEGALPIHCSIDQDQLNQNTDARYSIVFQSIKSLVLHEENIYFDFDKYVIRPIDYSNLDKIKNYLENFSFLNLDVSAHTDSKANEDYNLELSHKRAIAVENYFKNGTSTSVPGVQDIKQIQGLFYTVQIMTGGIDVVNKIKSDENPIQVDNINPITYRISKGRFRTLEEAVNYSKILRSSGYSDAFVVAYNNGKRYISKDLNSIKDKEIFTNADPISNTSLNYSSRMSLKWFGKKLPFVDCIEGVDCDGHLHQLNRRAELRLMLNDQFDIFELPTAEIVRIKNEEDLAASIKKWLLKL